MKEKRSPSNYSGPSPTHHHHHCGGGGGSAWGRDADQIRNPSIAVGGGDGRSTARRDADRCGRVVREHLRGFAAPGCQRVASRLSATVRCGGASFLEISKQAIGIKIQFPVMNPCFAIVLDFSVWYMNNLLPSSKIVSSQYASNCSNTWDNILITT